MRMDGSPARLLEILSDRFGAFEAIATSAVKLARFVPPDELPMEPLVVGTIKKLSRRNITGYRKQKRRRRP
jgi:hypothetical protein